MSNTNTGNDRPSGEEQQEQVGKISLSNFILSYNLEIYLMFIAATGSFFVVQYPLQLALVAGFCSSGVFISVLVFFYYENQPIEVINDD